MIMMREPVRNRGKGNRPAGPTARDRGPIMHAGDRVRGWGLVLGLFLLVVSPARPALAMSFFDFHGFSYLDGPANTVGTHVWIPALLNEIQPDPIWPLDFGANEYVIIVQGLQITSMETFGQVRNTTYAGGTIALICDPGKNAVWSPSPPNGLVPGTFTDGQPELTGSFTEMVMVFNTRSGSGTVSGTFTWTGGSLLSQIRNPAGWTYFGGVSNHQGLQIPNGYDLAWDPQIYGPETPNPVTTMSWGRLKQNYR